MARSLVPLSLKGLSLARRASSTEKSATGRAFRSAMTIRTDGLPYRSSWETERAINDGLLRSIWTYKAVDAIARSGAGLPVDITRGADPWSEQTRLDPSTSPLLRRRLNVKSSQYEFAISFRYRLFSQLLISRQGVFVEYARRPDGEIDFLSLLSPDKTSPIPSATRFVDGYEVHGPNGTMEVLPPDRVLWIKIPHPTDPYLSWTPLDAAGLSIDLDYYTRLYNRNFMANDGRPAGIASIKGPIPQEDEEILRERFRNPKPGEITLVESESIDFKDLSTSPRDASYSNLRAEVRDEILVAFGTPESVLGNASGRTYDNAEAEENIFWRMTMASLIRFVDLHLGTLTPGGDDDDLWVNHNTDNVQALQRPQRENEQRAMEQFREGAIFWNEMRTKIGMPTSDMPGANSFFIPAGKIGIGKDAEEQAAIANLKAIGAAPGQPGMPGQPDEAPPTNRVGSMLEQRRLGLPPRGSDQDPLQQDTARSPESIGSRRAIEARATERRREEKSMETKALGDGQKRSGHAVMLPVAPDKIQFLAKHFPLPLSEDFPHITLGYFKADEVDAEALHVAVARWAERAAPIAVTVGPEVKSFPAGDDALPLWLAVKSDEIHEAREALGHEMAALGIEFGGLGAKDYTPHLTLAYALPDAEVPQLSEPAFIRDTIDSVTIGWANGKASAYDLRGY